MRKVVKSSIFVVLIIVLILISSHSTVGSNEIVVTTEQELRDAVERPEVVIIIDNIIHLSDEVEVIETVTIRGSGTIKVSNDHRHFIVEIGGHLILKDNITLTRAEDHPGLGGGICLFGGSLTMYGGRIYNNKDLNGGGIRIRTLSGTSNLATFLMRGGEISGNTALFTGGGIFVEVGIANLQQGKIHSNTASGHGGVFATTRGSVLTIGHGMQIFDNTPINTHDQESTSLFMRLITPDIYRFAAIVIIALVGVFVSSKCQKRKQQKTPVEQAENS